MRIDPDRLYTPADDALRQIAQKQTLAKWRSEGVGPPYVKVGSLVRYKGQDLLCYLEANRVEPGKAS